MVFGYDQALQLPTVDLYDTQLMAMALNAAKDMYEKGEQQIKDFQKAYGDFLTPITADQNWWNQNVTGKVRDAINQIYARGGDPLRNAQDRAQLSMLINNMPYGDMAKKKQRAKNAEEYYKNMATLRLNDKYNEDFSKFLREDPSQWADDFMGVTSPTAFKTLKDATNDWYNNRTPRDLTPDEIKKLGLDSRYNYTGYFDSDLLNVAKGQTPGWQGTPISAFYRDQAYKQLQAMGIDKPTADQVETMLQRNIANAQQEWLVGPKKEKADEFVLDDYRTKNDIKASWSREAAKSYYDILPYADINGDGKLSADERSAYAKAGGGGKNRRERYDDIFEEARDTLNGKIDTKEITDPTEYIRNTAHYQNIQPKIGSISHTVTKDGTTYYTIPSSDIGKVLYTDETVSDVNSSRLVRYTQFNRQGGEYYFKPRGQMKAKKIIDSRGNEKYRYFISGTLQYSGMEEDITDASGSPKIYEMEVVDRRGNYGKKQEKR